MRIYDAYLALASSIIRHTNVFSETIPNLQFVSVIGSTLRLQSAAPHGLNASSYIGLPNRRTINAIAGVTMVNSKRYQITTAADHDLTSGYAGRSTVRLQDFTNGAWNGDIVLAQVYNRRTFDVSFNAAPGAPVLNGNEVLLELREYGLFARSLLPVTAIVSSTIFEVDLGADYSAFTFDPGDAVKRVRIAPAISVEVAIERYSTQAKNNLWAFVTAPQRESQLSKSRRATTDSLSEIGTNTGTPQIFNDGFDLFIFAPTSDESTGIRALDLCRHDLLLPILKSLRGIKLDSGTSSPTQHTVSLISHGLIGPDSTESFLIYRYSFELPIQFNDDDSNRAIETLSFNGITLDVNLETGVSFGSVNISLDVEPS